AAGAGTRKERQCRLAQCAGGASRRPRERAHRIQRARKAGGRIGKRGRGAEPGIGAGAAGRARSRGGQSRAHQRNRGGACGGRNLESQLAQETANGRALSVDHSTSADKRIVELQSEGALMREKLLLLENGQALAANGARSDAGRGVALVASPHRKRERLDRRAGAA